MDVNILINSFYDLYGREQGKPEVYLSPGRVNLIGEHTDYNGGYVLPCALTYGTYVIIRRNNLDLLRMTSTNFDYAAELHLDSVREKQPGKWFNYPLGVIDQLINAGMKPEGVDLLFSGNIPNGAGLSSSASIEMATAKAFNDLFKTGLTMIDLIKLAKRAENEFVGVNCGIMDMFAVGMGKKDHAVFLDCATLDFDLVPLDLGDCRIVIMNTNKKRGLADSKYNERVAECRAAVQYLSKFRDISQLGELTYQEFVDLTHHIPDIIIRKRAKHVISENQRVLDALKALRDGNLPLFGKLMNASHNSLRYDYEVTGPELDVLVEETRQIEGVLGARMTGAGFGGCAIALVKASAIESLITRVGLNYKNRIGLEAEFYISEAGNGVEHIL